MNELGWGRGGVAFVIRMTQHEDVPAKVVMTNPRLTESPQERRRSTVDRQTDELALVVQPEAGRWRLQVDDVEHAMHRGLDSLDVALLQLDALDGLVFVGRDSQASDLHGYSRGAWVNLSAAPLPTDREAGLTRSTVYRCGLFRFGDLVPLSLKNLLHASQTLLADKLGLVLGD